MATITKIADGYYVSGGSAVTLNQGDLAVICGFWSWEATSTARQYTSGSILIDSVEIPYYWERIASNDVLTGILMSIAPYIATTSGSVSLSLNPIDDHAERQIRLVILKYVPDAGKQFNPTDYFISWDDQPRIVGGSGSIILTNQVGDYLVGMAGATSATGTTITWTSPATEQSESIGLNVHTVATQTSESTDDAFGWTMGTGDYNGGVGFAIRETLIPIMKDLLMPMWFM